MIWLETNFIWFVLYSVAGWIWEVIICSVPAKNFINRGFLNGPYCPIYGAGALLVTLLLGGIKNPILLFFAASLLTCILEYITSYMLRSCDVYKTVINLRNMDEKALKTMRKGLSQFIRSIYQPRKQLEFFRKGGKK